MNPGLGACHLGEVGLILRIGPFTAVVAIAGNSIDPFTGQELDHRHIMLIDSRLPERKSRVVGCRHQDFGSDLPACK